FLNFGSILLYLEHCYQGIYRLFGILGNIHRTHSIRRVRHVNNLATLCAMLCGNQWKAYWNSPKSRALNLTTPCGIAVPDQQIDALVDELYDLKEEEIGMVEG
ncbi:MAG: hypothetical protein FWH27_02900, partial [Planctomycetaceae bacterium]|nr:hypothetical protein [Planctomycetaceae bacterium]